jgi:hypothetical protein
MSGGEGGEEETGSKSVGTGRKHGRDRKMKDRKGRRRKNLLGSGRKGETAVL